MKQTKRLKTAHTSNSKIGMGSFTGLGVKNPIGKMREGMGMRETPKKKLKSPPKSLA